MPRKTVSRSKSPVQATAEDLVQEAIDANSMPPSKTGPVEAPHVDNQSDVIANGGAVRGTVESLDGLGEAAHASGKTEKGANTIDNDHNGPAHGVNGDRSSRNSTAYCGLRDEATDPTNASSKADASTPMSGVSKGDVAKVSTMASAAAAASLAVTAQGDLTNSDSPDEVISDGHSRNGNGHNGHGPNGDVSNEHSLPSIETADSEWPSRSVGLSKKRSSEAAALEEQPPAKRSKSPGASDDESLSPRYPSPPGEAATPLDKETWDGWCEIESDPAYISSMIRMMGVKNVSIREAFTTDIEEFKLLPQPVHGLIFLFRYREDDGSSPQEKSCPDNVWFANQMPAQNSCATLAIMNILMNRPEIELGEHLHQFKESTADDPPNIRGMAFASFRFIKQIHNSFAKKMDMLEADQTLANKAQKSNRRGSADLFAEKTEGIEENAHHFFAFLPIDGHVWKLDGLDYQPTNLGPYDMSEPESWMGIAANRMAMLMATAGDEDYNILAVVQSPVVALQEQLAASHASIAAAEERLESLDTDWRSFLCAESSESIPEPLSPTLMKSLGVTEEQITSAKKLVKDEILPEGTEELMARREQSIKDQSNTQREIVMAMQDEADEDAKAKARQHDYGPVIQAWLGMLAENGYMQEHLGRFTK